MLYNPKNALTVSSGTNPSHSVVRRVDLKGKRIGASPFSTDLRKETPSKILTSLIHYFVDS